MESEDKPIEMTEEQQREMEENRREWETAGFSLLHENQAKMVRWSDEYTDAFRKMRTAHLFALEMRRQYIRAVRDTELAAHELTLLWNAFPEFKTIVFPSINMDLTIEDLKRVIWKD